MVLPSVPAGPVDQDAVDGGDDDGDDLFFSSRRRHTRLQGDWSSDVCSSDLAIAAGSLRSATSRGRAAVVRASARSTSSTGGPEAKDSEPARKLSTPSRVGPEKDLDRKSVV